MWRDICIANRDRAAATSSTRYRERARRDARKLLESGDGAGAGEAVRRGARRARPLAGPVRSSEPDGHLELAPSAAPPARCGCRARRASPTACCCSPRWPRARPRSRGLLDADDTRVMLEALAALGVAFDAVGPTSGERRRAGAFPVKQAELFLGNAGTAFRPLTAALAFSAASTACRACRACTSGRSATWSMRCAASARASTTPASEGFPPLAHRTRRRSRCDERCACAATCPRQFLTALLMALPLVAASRAHRGAGRAHLQALRRDHAEHDAALRRRGASATAGAAFDVPAGALHVARARSSSRAMRRRPRTSSPPARSAAGRCAWKASGATASRATCASPKCWSAWARSVTLGDDWIEVAAASGKLQADRPGPATTFPMPR